MRLPLSALWPIWNAKLDLQGPRRLLRRPNQNRFHLRVGPPEARGAQIYVSGPHLTHWTKKSWLLVRQLKCGNTIYRYMDFRQAHRVEAG